MPLSPPELLQKLQHHIGQLVLGKPEQVKLALPCLVARGHLLLEDVPGVGKTTLAEGLARAFSMSFARVQFTADLLPSDILGAQVFLQAQGRFEFRPGPVFHQLVLADELNRAPPRTQSALLEAMAQGQVSLDGVTHQLPQPFVVIATQNPLDLSGTYPLPDSQLDRFLLRLSLGHLPADVETDLLINRREDPLHTFQPLADAAALYKLVTRHGIERTRIVVHGAPDHSTAGRVTRMERRAATEEVVRFRRASPYRYLPPSYYGRGVAADVGAARRAYGAPRNGPRGAPRGYSYGYGF